MDVVYTTSTNEFEPISFGSNYLYDQYDKIQSFLIKNFGDDYKGIIAKPVLSSGFIKWHGDFDHPLSRLSDLPGEVQTIIKSAYWDLKSKIDEHITQLSQTKDREKNNWANLLQEVFNDENNIILSDGNGWILLWGWQFRNRQENYLPPDIRIPKKSASLPSNQKNDEDTNNKFASDLKNDEETIPFTNRTDSKNLNQLNQNDHDEDESIEPNSNINASKGIPFWVHIKRWLRKFIYRFWVLLFLLLFIIFLFCFFNKYCAINCENNCSKIDSLNNQLIQIENKLNERCNKN